MSYTESTNVISIEDALPMSDVDGKTSENYFDFSVTSNLSLGEDDPTTKVNYSIEIEPLIETFKQTFSYNKNATEEQINSCTTALLDAIGVTEDDEDYEEAYSFYNTFCSGGEYSGLTLQTMVDNANSGEDDYLYTLYILEPSGVVNMTREWTVKKNATEEEIKSCTLWFLDYAEITEEDEDYEEGYTVYSKLCSGKNVEEIDGLTLQYLVDYEFSQGGEEYLPSLAQTGIIEYVELENLDKGYYPLKDDNIKIYLEDITNNEVLIDSELISDLSNYELYNTNHIHTTEIDSVTTKYRLRAWIDYDTDASSWNENNRHEYKFRVNVNTEEGNNTSAVIPTISALETISSSVKTANISYKYVNGANTTIDGVAYNVDDNGVFLYDGTDDNGGNYPIYYYRGNVDNNNVIFGGFCWKIVRTTSTGGIKLIYNGEPTDGVCDNTGTSSQIGYSDFNENDTSPAHVGYMYGTVYPYSTKIPSGTIIYGNDVTYSNGAYTLVNTKSSTSWSTDRTILAEKYHYTCLNSTGTCSSVYYIVGFNDSNSSVAKCLTFTGGDNLDSAKEKMYTNTTNSTIKTTIDNWYKTNLTSYTNMLENTIFCNDRSSASDETYSATLWGSKSYTINGGALASKDTKAVSQSFSKSLENTVKGTPSLECTNINDRFSLSTDSGGTSGYGNNALTYPVGLLTLDEVELAGSQFVSSHSNYYLYTGQFFWVLSPAFLGSLSRMGIVYSGDLNLYRVDISLGVRPVVSLQLGTEFEAGTDGTASNPYVVVTD